MSVLFSELRKIAIIVQQEASRNGGHGLSRMQHKVRLLDPCLVKKKMFMQ